LILSCLRGYLYKGYYKNLDPEGKMTYQDEYSDCSWVGFEVLEGFLRECLINCGVPKEDAGVVADVLITSDKRGIDSHGIGRLKPIYIDRIDQGILNPVTRVDIVKETDTTVVLDGNNGMGHVAAKQAMRMAIDKAKKSGMGMAAVRNSSHYGIAGYYALMACREGMIGMTRTDTKEVLKDLTTGGAALAPLGGLGEETAGYKGYGYATVVEVLSAALQGGSFLKALNGFDEEGNRIPYPLGHFFIAINPGFFMGLETFKRIAGAIMRDLRGSRKAEGEDRIYTAGEKEQIAWNYRKDHGCPVPPVLQKQMQELRDRWNMDYRFPWD
jgi:LDH2 family malate/lactate/ureidoglycolate dehydrogenase